MCAIDTYNHWSNKETTIRYVEKNHCLFPWQEERSFEAGQNTSCSSNIWLFWGQTTPQFYALLRKFKIISVIVPPIAQKNFSDWTSHSTSQWKMRYIRDSICGVPKKTRNSWKLLKLQRWKWMWQVRWSKQRVLCSWFVSFWQSFRYQPMIVIKRFRKAGILDVVRAVTH